MPKKQPAPAERVAIARDPKRPNIREYIDALFHDFFEQKGDRAYGDDPSLVCGIALFHGMPVTVAGHCKGHDLRENVVCNFGMPNPEGYRKFLRAVGQAEKFSRPVITFIDTPGAYPGEGAEERGQGEAIARCLYTLSGLRVPVLAVITGEGGSGGALAAGVADRVLMLENAVYSVLSPEGFASILWKDAGRSREAAAVMKMTAEDLYAAHIIDRIVAEPRKGAQASPETLMRTLENVISEELHALMLKPVDELLQKRFTKYREIGREGTGRDGN